MLTEQQRHSAKYLQGLCEKGVCFELTSAEQLSLSEPCVQFEASLIIFGEMVNLEKLFAVQQALIGHLELHNFIPGNNLLGRYSVEASVTILNSTGLQQQLEICAVNCQVELAVLNTRPTLSEPGLILMDMDSTVIGIECIDEIAKLAGVGQQVSEVTELAMQGKLDFAESLTSRVACLTDANEQILQQVRDSLPIMPGITGLLTVLRQYGWKLAIASGGFTYFADYLAQRLDLDFAIANRLEIENGKLTGKVLGDIVTAQTKADTLVNLAKQWQIEPHQTIALGDGANDLVMMSAAGLGVAFHAKPVVRQQADAAIRFAGADALLVLLAHR